jgi:hypothetical protein
MTTYRWKAYAVQGPDEPLLKGELRAPHIAAAARKAEADLRDWARQNRDKVFPHPPGRGKTRAVRPACIAITMASTQGGQLRLHPVFLRPPIPPCVPGRDHEWGDYGGPYDAACLHCGLVREAVEGGYLLYYRREEVSR